MVLVLWGTKSWRLRMSRPRVEQGEILWERGTYRSYPWTGDSFFIRMKFNHFFLTLRFLSSGRENRTWPSPRIDVTSRQSTASSRFFIFLFSFFLLLRGDEIHYIPLCRYQVWSIIKSCSFMHTILRTHMRKYIDTCTHCEWDCTCLYLYAYIPTHTHTQ